MHINTHTHTLYSHYFPLNYCCRAYTTSFFFLISISFSLNDTEIISVSRMKCIYFWYSKNRIEHRQILSISHVYIQVQIQYIYYIIVGTITKNFCSASIQKTKIIIKYYSCIFYGQLTCLFNKNYDNII